MTAAPPLLVLAAGGKRRPRRARIPVPSELSLHMQVAKLLREHGLPEWQWAHYPSGEVRDVRTGTKLKQMGTKRGWPDFIFISPHGSLRCLELKRPGGALTDEQDEFLLWCIKHGVPYVVAWTMDDVLAAFSDWGCLRIVVSKPERGSQAT